MTSQGVPILVEPGVEFATPELQLVLKLWNEKRGNRRFPARADFSMRDLKTVLRNLVFMESTVSSDGYRFFVRYMGSELDNQLMPMTGHFADEVLPEYFKKKWQAVWSKAMASQVPVRSLARAEFRARRYLCVEGFYAPLSDGGNVANMLMAVVYYHEIESNDLKTRQIAEQLQAQFDCKNSMREIIGG